MKKLSLLIAAAATGIVLSASAYAQEVTLKLHQMLPPQATIPAHAIKPWIEKVEKESGGRIKVDEYDAMALGGKPPELIDQVKDGVVDIVWTVIGYTPGRFPATEAFELPFVMTTGEATSMAIQAYCEKHCMDEFKDYKVIAWHAHGPGLIHSRNPVTKLEDMKGLKIRGGSRVVNQMLVKLGATPIGMPVPAVSEALSKGVIDATTIPWEVTVPLKVSELVHNHTGFSGTHGLYTQTFVFAMNKNAYNKLPADLKKVIDDNSGMPAAKLFGKAMDDGDKVGLAVAKKLNANIITLDPAETQRWKDAAEPVIQDWIKEMDGKGMDGKALVDEARSLVDKYTKM